MTCFSAVAVAAGAGFSFARPSMAFLALAFLSLPSAASSNRYGCTLALARCAAICAPITPAPSTAALRIRIRASASTGREPGAEPSFCLRSGRTAVSTSFMSHLHGAAGDGPRLAALVDGDVGQLGFGHLHDLAAAAAALGEELHVHGDRGLPD